jgi:hypothetical protein
MHRCSTQLYRGYTIAVLVGMLTVIASATDAFAGKFKLL